MNNKEYTNKELFEYVKLFDSNPKFSGDRFSMSTEGFRKMIMGIKEMLESSQSSKCTEIWYPLDVHGIFTPFQYACTDYMDKDKICSSKEECLKLCDEMNIAKGGDDWCFKHIDMLVSEYGLAKDSDLTDTAKELKSKVISKVNEWKGKLDAGKTVSESASKVPEPECKHEWIHIDLASYPPIPTRRCLKCGREEYIPRNSSNGNWTEGKGY